MKIRIKNRMIGEDEPCFIIAEAGANFRISDNPDENYKQAIRLINIAADAGADAIKFQVYRAKEMYVKDAGYADYIGKKKAIFDIIQEMELPYDWLPKLKKEAQDRGLLFFACPFDKESADQLEQTGVDLYKIASYSITDKPLLTHIAKKGKPIVMSTGCSDIEDIKKAVKWIEEAGNSSIILLQCTAKYPAPLQSINLRVIEDLGSKFTYPIGLSDHSHEPIIAPLGAVALGADVIEKHFTTDNNLPGPDHGFALLPDELTLLVRSIRQLEEALGTKEKKVIDEEKELHDFARHFIYTTKKIGEGDLFSSGNIAVLRPGKKKHGLAPEHYDEIIGKKAQRDLGAGEPVDRGCIDD